mmetsp:Transcript_31886/g.91887  ORF Transcript_31886/g.91887 Transcript_31886/m.91887 type:complete len:408 (+) Transcript_31886:118-1341(+)
MEVCRPRAAAAALVVVVTLGALASEAQAWRDLRSGGLLLHQDEEPGSLAMLRQGAGPKYYDHTAFSKPLRGHSLHKLVADASSASLEDLSESIDDMDLAGTELDEYWGDSLESEADMDEEDAWSDGGEWMDDSGPEGGAAGGDWIDREASAAVFSGPEGRAFDLDRPWWESRGRGGISDDAEHAGDLVQDVSQLAQLAPPRAAGGGGLRQVRPAKATTRTPPAPFPMEAAALKRSLDASAGRGVQPRPGGAKKSVAFGATTVHELDYQLLGDFWYSPQEEQAARREVWFEDLLSMGGSDDEEEAAEAETERECDASVTWDVDGNIRIRVDFHGDAGPYVELGKQPFEVFMRPEQPGTQQSDAVCYTGELEKREIVVCFRHQFALAEVRVQSSFERTCHVEEDEKMGW